MVKKSDFVDNTQHGCWGYNPEPGKHDAFVGWRTILDRDYRGRPRLDYVPGRGSCRGFENDCERLVKWWSKGRDSPESKFLKDGTTNLLLFRKELNNCVLTAYAKKSSDYAYISLYLDYTQELKNEN